MLRRALAPLALAPLALAGSATGAHAQSTWVPGHPYLVVETNQRYNRLQDAINAIDHGKGTIRIDPGKWDDCGVNVYGDVTLEAAIPGKTIFSGPRVCETKAIFVSRGRKLTVSGFIFTDIHVNDGNGAGIRVDAGDLVATNNLFRNSDDGILTGPNPAGTILIDRSSFVHDGRCGGYAACAHSIYIGDFGSATVTNSHFSAGLGGHYIKVRAAHVTIANNVLDDTEGRATNYMIDLPNGAAGRVTGNMMTQGSHKENPSALIAVAAEGHDHSSNGLVIAGNVARLGPGAAPTVFVADWSGDRLAIGSNQLAAGIAGFQRR